MDIRNDKSMKSVVQFIKKEYKGIEIDHKELENINCNMPKEDINSNSIIINITDKDVIDSLLSDKEKNEIHIAISHLNKDIDNIDSNSYEYKICSGQLITLILNSNDSVNLSNFIMEGNGEKLFAYLSNLISTDIEKVHNPLDEVIDELNQFKPYGKYFT